MRRIQRSRRSDGLDLPDGTWQRIVESGYGEGPTGELIFGGETSVDELVPALASADGGSKRKLFGRKA